MGAQYTRMAAMKQTALQATAIRLPHTILREQTADRFFFNPMENLSQTAGPSQEAEWKLYQEQTRTELIHSMDFDANDAYLLEKIAMAEAESEDTEGNALVMLVVLNRVWDARFPDTIEEVIMQDGAFTPVSNGRYDKVEPDADCMKAMELITVEHWDESQGALYFEKASDESTWHSRNLQKLFTHGAHTFYTEKE